MQPIFASSIQEDFQNLMDIFNAVEDSVSEIPSKLPTAIVSSSFPPADIYYDEEGGLNYEFAVSGYSEDQMEIKFEEDHLILILKPFTRDSNRNYIQKGLKACGVTASYFAPATKFDTSKIQASLKNGLLKVYLPKREDQKPVAISISK